MEQFGPISNWLYYTHGLSPADIKDKRIIVGVTHVLGEDEVLVEEDGENFTDYLDDDRRIEIYGKVLEFFAREGAEPLTEVQKERLEGLRSIVADKDLVVSDSSEL